MKLKKIILAVSQMGIVIFIIGGLTACQASRLSYLGAAAAPNDRIVLEQGGPHEGTWQAPDLFVPYRYHREANTLQLSGLVNLDNLGATYPVLERLHLWVNFIDLDGRVLDYKLISVSPYRKGVENLSFSHHLEMPPATAGMAFSYQGRVMDGGGSEGTSWDFSHFPRRPKRAEK